VTTSFGTLYKYRGYSAQSLEMLINREFYFASPAQLNDPYDCQISIRDSLSSAVTRAEKLGNPDLSEKLKRLQKIDHVYEKLNQDPSGVGVFSLSRVPDSVLMWTHYTGNHSGFCAGFHLSNVFITHENSHQIVGATDVGYLDANPFTGFFEEIAAAKKPPEWEAFWQSLLSIGMAAKAQPWGYEAEVRVIRKGTGPVPFTSSELVEIIFGLNMPSISRVTVRKILSGSEWSHVRFKEVTRSDGFALQIRDASAT
jgi:hypothetical protein